MIDNLIVGVGAAGIALLFRALPWPKSWLKVKPWACSTCLGFHGAWVALLLLHGAALSFTLQLALQYFIAGAVATLIVARVHPPELELVLP